jgi:TatD DNase family protein
MSLAFGRGREATAIAHRVASTPSPLILVPTIPAIVRHRHRQSSRPSRRAPITVMSAATADTAAPTLKQYVDVHCHIIHEQFAGEEDDVAQRARDKGLEFCVVNGLEPKSNRAVLELCARHPNSLLPALGIYPLDAACNVISADVWPHPFPPPDKFDVDAEVEWIDQMCAEGKVVAVGECGLDAYYCTDPAQLAEQERVLRRLIVVAKKHDLPLILHTRKAELRTFEILQEMEVTKADFHCFCGKAKLGKRIAEAGYYLSIPSAVNRSEQFKKLVKEVPLEQLLTETDSPYQGPEKDMRNEPMTVPIGVAVMAMVKGITEEEAMVVIRANFRRLMNI